MVSILLLSWNHGKYIAQAIGSITRQTYSDIEVIYLDNNSTDNSFETAQKILSASGLKFQCYRRDKNYGISANYNFLFQKSKGEFISLLSADDWLHRDNLAAKVPILQSRPEVAMVQSGGYKYYQDIDVYEPLPVITFPDEEVIPQLLKKNFISSTGMMLRRSAVEDVGGWNESLIAEDGELWMRILSKYKLASIHRFLYFYRQHREGVSNDAEFMYKAHMEIFDTTKHLNDSQKQALQNIRDHYLSVKLKNHTSLSLLLKVIKHFRFEKMYLMLLLKSVLPVSWKSWYFKRSYKRKYGKVKVDY